MLTSNSVPDGGPDAPNCNITKAEAEYAAELKRQRLNAQRFRQRSETESLVCDRFARIAVRWSDFVQRESKGSEQRETLNGLLAEFGAVLTEVASRLSDDEFKTRWQLADHDQNFSNYRGKEYGRAWQAGDNEPLSRARYDEAVRIVSAVLESTFQAEMLRPAMERQALRGVLTYLDILLKGLIGFLRLEQKPTAAEKQSAASLPGNIGQKQARPPGPKPLGSRTNLPAEQLRKEMLKKNVYDCIKKEKKPGKGPQALLTILKQDKQFQELVRDAGLKLDKKLVRAALRQGTK